MWMIYLLNMVIFHSYVHSSKQMIKYVVRTMKDTLHLSKLA